MNAVKRIPVTLLTGFLGSGKTTLLRNLLADERMKRTAVIINEIGEIGLDHLLVGQIDQDMVLLKSGCVCCSVKTEFSETLKLLYQRAQAEIIPIFDRVIVETTGMADPIPLLKQLLVDESVAVLFSVQTVITTVDSLLPLDLPKQHIERLRQIAVADKIILTKTDLSHAFHNFVEGIAALNDAAEIIDSSDVEAVASLIFDREQYPIVRDLPQVQWIKQNSHLRNKLGQSLHQGMSSLCLYADQPLAWRSITLFLQKLARLHGENLLRIKGLIHIRESLRPVVIHGVQHYLFPESYLDTWSDDDPKTRIVIIFEGAIQQNIQALFDDIVLEPMH
ncbi:CobW family GTP-binding protein [Acinetobacter bereziniae]|uniref:CobW C-terminal domain-containing protein n=1 Tax=Acinetobacter bereziniae NIPH 3 TaxID=1217651 RepID=N8YRX4_ACIBZ|nr:GTP-binding protein [Acinetobacter bereziniae]ENV22333.1 hypothetical protein F963_01617 [Acinetobacter bereziniae NIPH 3]